MMTRTTTATAETTTVVIKIAAEATAIKTEGKTTDDATPAMTSPKIDLTRDVVGERPVKNIQMPQALMRTPAQVEHSASHWKYAKLECLTDSS